MLSRGGARSERDLNCQSADASGSNAAMQAMMLEDFMVDIASGYVVSVRRCHGASRGYINLRQVFHTLLLNLSDWSDWNDRRKEPRPSRET